MEIKTGKKLQAKSLQISIYIHNRILPLLRLSFYFISQYRREIDAMKQLRYKHFEMKRLNKLFVHKSKKYERIRN